MKRRRLRKWAKWACTDLAVATFTTAVLSGFYSVRCARVSADQSSVRFMILRQGQLTLGKLDGPPLTPLPQWTVQPWRGWCWGFSGEVRPEGLLRYWHAGLKW